MRMELYHKSIIAFPTLYEKIIFKTRPESSGNMMKNFPQMPFGSPEPSCQLALARAIMSAAQLTTRL